MDKVDQFDINYDSTKNDFGKLIKFVEQYPNKRINISLTSPIDLENIRVINKIHNNIYLKINDFKFLDSLKDSNYKYYFTFPVTTYTKLNQIFEFSVSDIYIAGDLCYSLSDVKNTCKEHNVQLRLIVNKVPSLGLGGLTPRDPIFRPDDAVYLSKYIDTIEFDCGNDWKKIEVLYKVWIEKRSWFGNLQEINSDILFYFPNKAIIPYLYTLKYNCGFGCMKGNNCNNCETLLLLALDAENNNIAFNKQIIER